MEQSKLNALVQILSRAPMTQAETLWAQDFVNEEQAAILATQAPPPPPAQEPERMPEGWAGHNGDLAIVGKNGSV